MGIAEITVNELIMAALILTIAIGLLSFGVGYYLGHKRALIQALMDPRHDCIFAVFHLILLKKLDEKDYDAVRDGIKMRARQYVNGYRINEKRLSKQELRKLKEITTGYELIENAEQLCGPLDPPEHLDIDKLCKNYDELNNRSKMTTWAGNIGWYYYWTCLLQVIYL